VSSPFGRPRFDPIMKVQQSGGHGNWLVIGQCLKRGIDVKTNNPCAASWTPRAVAPGPARGHFGTTGSRLAATCIFQTREDGVPVDPCLCLGAGKPTGAREGQLRPPGA
jgi:hypothetical protein